jgi:hypothetical protein
VQAVLAGSAALIPVAMVFERDAVSPLAWVLATACAIHILMVAGEITLTHGTAHAHAATREMVRGTYAKFFWIGLLLAGVGLAAVWLPLPAAVAALAGLLAFEHAFVQAGQSVPLA